METLTTALISAAVAIVTAVLGYKQGQKKSDAEATRTAFENYNYALESLRKEFEQRIEALQKENEELKVRIASIEKRSKKK
jgi:hypothetical protein